MGKNLLVTLADKNFVNQARQLFSSVYLNAGWDGDYMLLADKMKLSDIEWFKSKGIIVKDISEFRLSEKEHIGHGGYVWPSTVLGKIILFSEKFKKWDKIVFLDSDIIVRGSLDHLLKVKTFGAVEDHYPQFGIRFKDKSVLKRKKDLEVKSRLDKKFNKNAHCFNSGVLVIDTRTISQNSFSRLMRVVEDYKDLSYGDEPLLNIFFYKNWDKLPFCFNACVPYWMEHFGLKHADINFPILHFISRDQKNKPWTEGNPFFKEWSKNLSAFEKIDFRKKRKPSVVYSRFNIEKMESRIKFEKLKSTIRYFNPMRILRNDVGPGFNHQVDAFLGRCGLYLKTNCRPVYDYYYKVKYHGGLLGYVSHLFDYLKGFLGLFLKNHLPFLYKSYYVIKYHGGFFGYLKSIIGGLLALVLSKIKIRKPNISYAFSYKIKHHGGFFKLILYLIDKGLGYLGLLFKVKVLKRKGSRRVSDD